MSSFQASAARTPRTLLAAICLAVARAADHDAEAARVVDHGGGGPQHVRRVVVDRVVLDRAVVDHLVAELAAAARSGGP